MQETQVRSLGREDPLEKEMATHSSTLAWKIPWMEEPRRLQFMRLDRTERFHFRFHHRSKLLLLLVHCCSNSFGYFISNHTTRDPE